MRRRFLGVLLLGLLLFSAAGMAQRGGEEGPVPEKQTICWDCHVAWPALPLRSFYDIIVPDDGIVVGEQPSNVPVRIRNPWLHENVFTEVTMDLRDAPSLAFTSEQEPIVGDAIEGTVDVGPAGPSGPTGPYDANVTFEVRDAATSLRLQLTPETTSGPQAPRFQFLLYPGGNATGAPAVRLKATAPGEELVFEAGEEALRALGTGNWTAVVRVVPVDADNVTDPTGALQLLVDTDFTITRDVGFDVGGAPVAFRSSREALGQNQNLGFAFTLRRVADPQPDEQVRLTVNATVFYKHDDADNDDFGNVTKSLDMDVLLEDGRLVLLPPEDQIIIPTQQVTKVTPARISEAIGYLSAFLLIASIWSGGMFGRASRRQLNGAFGSAKRRVAFHNLLSYALTLAAIVHLVIFLVEAAFYWTLGLVWGGIALLAMLALGVTGAIQVPMIRRFNYPTWRWTHWVLALLAIVFTVVHILLDGANFTEVQNAVGWKDPLDPRL